MRPEQRAVALLLAVVLSGCAAQPRSAGAGPPWPILPPGSLGGTHGVEQILHAAYGNDEITLRCLVEVTPVRTRVIGLTALGQRVFSIEHDGDGLRAGRAAFAPEQIAPERILGDIQLAFWPLPALRAAVEPAGWHVVEPRPGLRRLLRGGRVVAEVHYDDPDPWSGRLWLVNLQHDYSLDIRSLPATGGAQ